MINLIPQEEKKRMKMEFYYKLSILLLLTLGFGALIAFITILPAYFFSSVKENIINAKLEMQENEPVPLPDQQTLAVIKEINGKISLIEKSEKDNFLVSQKVISAIIVEKMPEVKITSISYEITQKGKKVSIEGSALSREALLQFRRALEDNNLFKQVDLPISNFVKGSNIKFYLTLTPA